MNDSDAQRSLPESDLATFMDSVKGSQRIHPAIQVAATFAIAYAIVVGTILSAGSGLHALRAVFQ
jgi:hypothetical protein